MMMMMVMMSVCSNFGQKNYVGLQCKLVRKAINTLIRYQQRHSVSSLDKHQANIEKIFTTIMKTTSAATETGKKLNKDSRVRHLRIKSKIATYTTRYSLLILRSYTELTCTFKF